MAAQTSSVETASSEATTRRAGLLSRPPEVWQLAVKDISTADRVLSGITIFIEAVSTDTIADVKAKIDAKTGVPAGFQSIVSEGAECLDSHALVEYTREAKSTIHLVISPSYLKAAGLDMK